MFRSYDRGSGRISHAQFKTLMQKWAKDFGFVDDELSEEDAITLVRHYDDDDDGSISINEFCDALTAAPIAFRDQIDENHVEAAERNLWEELHNKPKGYVREEFNKLDERGDGHITIDEFKHFLTRHDIELNEKRRHCSCYDPQEKGSLSIRSLRASWRLNTSSPREQRLQRATEEGALPLSMSNYIDICKASVRALSHLMTAFETDEGVLWLAPQSGLFLGRPSCPP